jgi:UDP-N-acetylglucosamine 2-epimerase
LKISKSLADLKKILLIFGIRPEAIKMASVVLRLKEAVHLFQGEVAVTAQHRQIVGPNPGALRHPTGLRPGYHLKQFSVFG